MLVVLAAGCDDRRGTRRDAGGSVDGGGDAPAPIDAPFGLDAPFERDAGLMSDAAFPLDAPVMDAARPVDAPLALDARAPSDAGRDAPLPADAFVRPDAPVAPDASVGDAFIPGGGETIAFPIATDPRVASVDLYFWRAGDYVEGTRTTATPSITSLTTSLVLDSNSLTCDTQDVRVLVNSVEVGTFAIATGDTTIARTFGFAPIAGPTYTFRYETISEVGSGCGSAGYSNAGSTLTIR